MYDSIVDTLKQARAVSGRLWIRGYTTADGGTGDYLVQLHDKTFYPRLLAEAVTWLQDLDRMSPEQRRAAVFADDMTSSSCVTDVVLTLAVREALLDLRIKVGNVPADPTASEDDNAFAHTTPGVTVLRNLEVLQRPDRTVKSATVKTRAVLPSALAARYIKKHWPIAKYGAQFNLAPGKFTNLEVVSV